MLSKSHYKPSIILGFFIIFVIIFLNAIGPYIQLQQIGTFGLVPLLALITFFYDIKEFNSGKKELYIFTIILALSIITVFNYKGIDEFYRSLSLMTGALVSAYVVIGLTKKTNYDTFFHIGYILTIIILFFIMLYNGNISSGFASALDFRDRFLLNANAYSYYSVFANFSLFYLYLEYRNKALVALLITLPIVFLAITFTTQSRAGLFIIILINILFWVFVNKSFKKNIIKRIARVFILSIVFIIFIIKFIDLYEGSRISHRVNQTTEREDAREILFYEGIEVFVNNPVFGVGLGQFPFYSKLKLFTHNSYTEILAEQGIIGGVFLLMLYLTPTIKSYKNFRIDPKNSIYRCNLLFFIVFLIYNNAYVFYKFPFSMMYFFLIISIQRNNSVEIATKNDISLKKLQCR